MAVVTNVSYDHVEVLGPTLARHRRREGGDHQGRAAGSWWGRPTPSSLAVFAAAADEAGAAETWVRRGRNSPATRSRVAVGGRLIDLRTPGAEYPEVYLPLHGAHQGDNAAMRAGRGRGVLRRTAGPRGRRARAVAVRVPGRMEVVGRAPAGVLDGAHNVAGAHALAQALIDEFADRR